MKLTIEERVILSGILPVDHTYQVIKAKVKLVQDMGFEEEETRKYDVQSTVEGGQQQIRYNKEAAHGYEKDIKIPPILKQVIKEILVNMDKEKKINHHTLSLYEKFVL